VILDRRFLDSQCIEQDGFPGTKPGVEPSEPGTEVNSAAWALLASVIGGLVGASIKFTFDDVLGPILGWRRETRRVVRRFTTPLLRSGEALERRINNMVRNVREDWYVKDEFFRISILYAFAEHLGWIRIVEKRFGFVPAEAVSEGESFTRRLNGLFRALTSHAYFRTEEPELVSLSAIPRLMLAAVGEVMMAPDGETVIGFTEFATRYVNDAQFNRWFTGIDEFLGRARPGDSLSWDRLIIAGAELRALIGFLDPKARMVRRLPMANLDLLATPGLALQLATELEPWAEPPKERAKVTNQSPSIGNLGAAPRTGFTDTPKEAQ
jgi:hypothetical protein